ncbi:Retrotransposable element Tf2 protein type 1 [Gossypium australe]|uniref:Retrotransposable element Tf2 protein type 1 n=1 Tax=Gossypium australe TaxID=47621 RepID=A0A5B6VNF0_9ROSI|nr:Retrotransposable element Tf2 protein type 1 [Gossypium australe]
MLLHYRSDSSHVLSMDEIDLQPDLTYNEETIKIIAREVKELRNKRVLLVKVLWHRDGVEEAILWCRSPTCCLELNKRNIIRPELVREMEEKNAYTDKKRKGILFEVEDKDVTPHFIGPYKVLERVGPVAYRLALLLELSKIHNVFHISMLRRY